MRNGIAYKMRDGMLVCLTLELLVVTWGMPIDLLHGTAITQRMLTKIESDMCSTR